MVQRVNPARLLTFVLIWFLSALACNYGTGPRASQPGAAASLQQTLQALDERDAEQATSVPPVAPATPVPPAGPPTAPAAGMDQSAWEILPPTDPSQDFQYYARSGDTLEALANRFGVEPHQILGEPPILPSGYLSPGQPVRIPNTIGSIDYPSVLLPDSEVINSPSTQDFDIPGYVEQAGGFLSAYSEAVGDEWLTGEEIIQRVAVERSVNPRLLLAFLEYRSNWVLGEPTDPEQIVYPIGFYAPGHTRLYKELTLTANHVNIAFYGWRTGEFPRLTFREGTSARINPLLNAGTVGVQNIFSKFYEQDDWQTALYGDPGFMDLYKQMFGDPWVRAAAVEPLLHGGVTQPWLELPFAKGEGWSFTGGPHRILNLGSPLGALDFGPAAGGPGCAVSPAWVTAPAAGLVTRSRDGIMTIDLDGDGREQTGWVVFLLHIATFERVQAGVFVQQDDRLGHPSCEGGSATGSHVHLARKYNGEWMAADGPLPFILSGWIVTAGSRPYQGSLRNGNTVVAASPGGAGSSIIVR